MRFIKYFVFFVFVFVLILGSKTGSASTSVSGSIKDSEKNVLPGAGVSLHVVSDSSIISSVATDTAGLFTFLNVNPGKYLLKISYVSYDDKFIPVTVEDQPVNAGVIILYEKATSLKAVNIDAETVAAQAKGDTVQFNADAFKVNKDATAEDLATKMPGITMQDGKVQAQGEEVKKVLIDGKPFLGDDPNAALKNLPAEAIDKIQVFDRKSDQSVFTGFDDGNTTKTINIVTRPQFRNGTFGKVYSGAGTNELWKAGMNINFFKDKRKLSILGNTNTVNEQNFTADDLLGVVGTSSGNRRGGQYGRSGSGGNRFVQQNELSNFLVDQKNGIATTYSAGANYTNQWEGLSLTFSYFFNQTQNKSTSDLFRSFYAGSDVLNYTETGSAESKNINHRASLNLEYKFDTLRSILFQPRFSHQQNNGTNLTDGINNGSAGLLSRAVTEYTSKSTGYNFSAPLLYRHGFQKKGRTFSANLTPGYNENNSENNLNSYTQYVSDTLPNDSLNQFSTPRSNGWTQITELTYTEPVTEKSLLSVTYKNYYSNTASDKQTYAYSPSEELYNQLDTALSSIFDYHYFSQSFGSNFRYQVEKWNFNAGITYQQAELNNDQTFPSFEKVDKRFGNILPNAMFQYRFTTKKNVRFFYRSNTNSPSVSQLQQVINNNNPLQLSTGNPDLKQDWQNTIGARYSAVNSEKNSSFFFFINSTFTRDYIGNSTLIAAADSLVADGITLYKGSQLNTSVNLSGYYTFRSFINYSFPIKKLKSVLSLNSNWNYSHTPSLINLETNYSTTNSNGFGFSLSSNVSEKIDFTVSSNGMLNTISNSLQADQNNNSHSINSRIKIQVMPWKGLVLLSDLNHTYNSGLSTSFNQDYIIWNAGIGYKFLKNRVAEIRLSGYDLLNKNTSVTRNTTDIYYEDIRYNQVQRYFMLTFTYNLKFFQSLNP